MSLSTFPPDYAGPGQIRQYLSDHLVSKHDTSLALAREVAEKWQIGRGVDLRHTIASVHQLYQGPDSFSDIFGPAIGPFLYRSVQEDFLEQWHASSSGILFKRVTLATVIIISILVIWEITRPSRKHRLRIAASRVGAVLGLSTAICAVLAYGYAPYLMQLCCTLSIIGMLVPCFSILVAIQKKSIRDAKQKPEDKVQPNHSSAEGEVKDQ